MLDEQWGKNERVNGDFPNPIGEHLVYEMRARLGFVGFVFDVAV